MTQAKNIVQSIDNDDMPSEYDFSKMGQPIRGKHAKKIREQGYSVIVHHEDGTSTTTHITPEDIARRDHRDPLVNQSAEARSTQTTYSAATPGQKSASNTASHP